MLESILLCGYKLIHGYVLKVLGYMDNVDSSFSKVLNEAALKREERESVIASKDLKRKQDRELFIRRVRTTEEGRKFVEPSRKYSPGSTLLDLMT